MKLRSQIAQKLLIFWGVILGAHLNQAQAYSIYSGLTEGCHEIITWAAFNLALPDLPPPASLEVPKGEVWRQFANSLLSKGRLSESSMRSSDERFQFMIVSLFIGVRSLDTEGHAVTNLSSLRQIHADPDPKGQYAHALRGAEDDAESGDRAAVEGTRTALREAIISVIESQAKPLDQQVINAQLYFDFYGLVEIEVWEPAYLVGRGLHTLQDSFAHTIRSDDLRRIRHVLNYVDAIAGALDEEVDGVAHSVAMDRCDGESAEIARMAQQASGDYILAVNEVIRGRSTEPIEALLELWVTYEPGCTYQNEYCDSKWRSLAHQEPTGPYLEEFIGCQESRDQQGSPLLMVISLLGLLMSLRRRVVPSLFCVLLSLMVGSTDLGAEPFVRAEFHGSILSDSPNKSVLASSLGYGLSAGIQRDNWQIFGHIEHNRWHSSELDDRLNQGALNAAVGGAYLFAKGKARTSLMLGPSALLFDTVFHSAGTIGYFVDLRPIELSWAPFDWGRLYLTPFNFTYVSPVTSEPSIRMVLYRTIFGLEGHL